MTTASGDVDDDDDDGQFWALGAVDKRRSVRTSAKDTIGGTGTLRALQLEVNRTQNAAAPDEISLVWLAAGSDRSARAHDRAAQTDNSSLSPPHHAGSVNRFRDLNVEWPPPCCTSTSCL
ncbi:hypothetical protein ZHAS_00015019 [Anopheles sinensis]|uniref:Uncharacterized protein n=1 Tax=Anopheles sinensis TaxID=74873 RepID=A0A084W9W2_ANOSI|nr:hypothetical protein ZHAS_00015019 [Anopheles sinensis]